MQARKIGKDRWIIRVQRGENLVSMLREFCTKRGIRGGFFFGIGAVDQVELAHYDVRKKQYAAKTFRKALEMVSLIGNVGVEKELIVHAHAMFADKSMKTIGGHLVEGRVSGTAEIYFIETTGLKKAYDSETGLKLFQLQ